MASVTEASRPAKAGGDARRASRGRRWGRRLLLALPVLVGLYALIGFVLVPWAAQRWAVPMVSDMLNGEVSVDVIRTNPFTLSLALEGVEVRDEGGTRVLGLDGFYGNLQASSLVREGIVLRDVSLAGPYVMAVLEADGSLNLASLFKPSTEPSVEPITLPRVRGERLAVSGGTVVFVDRMIEGAFERQIEPIEFEVLAFDTEPTHANTHRFSAATQEAENVTWEGQVLVNPLEATGTITVKGFDLSVYEPYIRQLAPLSIGEGKASLELSYRLVPAASPRVVEATLTRLTLDSLRVALAEHPLLSLGSLTVEQAVADAVARSLTVGSVSVSGAEVTVERDVQGGLAVLGAVEGLMGGVEAERAVVEEVRGDGGLLPVSLAEGLPRPLDEAARGLIGTINDATQPWQLRVERVEVASSAAHWRDAAVPTPVALSFVDTSLSAGPVASDAAYATTFEVSTSLASGGTIRAAGRVEPMTPRLTLATHEASVLSLGVLGPYVEQADARLRLPAGSLDVEGRDLGVAMPGGADGAAAVPELAVGLLSVRGSVDLQVHELGPALDVPLRDIDVKLLGLDTAAGDPLNLDVSTRIFDGSISVDGTVAPDLATPMLSTLDLRVVIDKFALRPLSPVSGEFVGRAIADGTLNTKAEDALTISLVKQQLEALIPLRIASFDFGEKVVSENATTLPVGLAVAILKGPDGTISPPPIRISGDLSDPSISVAGIVMHAVTNVVVGVASSPFQMLGGLVPGGGGADGPAPDLSFVSFAPGGSALFPEAKQKLDLLGKAMMERPALRMAVAGVPTREVDEPALRREAFVRAVQARTAEALDRGDARRADPAGIAVSEAQYRDAVMFAFQAMQPAGDASRDTPAEPAEAVELPDVVEAEMASEDVGGAVVGTADAQAAHAPQDSEVDAVAPAEAEGGGDEVESVSGAATADSELLANEPATMTLELPVLTDDAGASVAPSGGTMDEAASMPRRLRAGRSLHSGMARARTTLSQPSNVTPAHDGQADAGVASDMPEASADSDERASSEGGADAALSEATAEVTAELTNEADDTDETDDTGEAAEADAAPAMDEATASASPNVANAPGSEAAKSEAPGSEVPGSELLSEGEAVAEGGSEAPAVPFEEAESAVLARVPLEPQAFVSLRQQRVRAVTDYLVGVAGLPLTRVVASEGPAELKPSATGDVSAAVDAPRVVFEVMAD